MRENLYDLGWGKHSLKGRHSHIYTQGKAKKDVVNWSFIKIESFANWKIWLIKLKD